MSKVLINIPYGQHLLVDWEIAGRLLGEVVVIKSRWVDTDTGGKLVYTYSTDQIEAKTIGNDFEASIEPAEGSE